jgi:5-formyltetrahydrofolate cyclo-ligase
LKQLKTKLRKQLLKQRRSLSVDSWQNKSELLCQQLADNSLFQNAQTVLGYFSIHQEPDLSPLFREKTWGFPRCVENSLHWHFWEPGEDLHPNQYGIFEPHTQAPIITPETVDLILVPAVACDYQGYRLGYGGGFYDRMLEQSQWSGVKAIAIVFDFAYLPQLPREDWDQQLDGVCTESVIKLSI